MEEHSFPNLIRRGFLEMKSFVSVRFTCYFRPYEALTMKPTGIPASSRSVVLHVSAINCIP